MLDKDRCDINCCVTSIPQNANFEWTSAIPTQYRLRKRPCGELVLQGEYQSGGTKDGIPYSGYEWKDIETVDK